MCIKTIFALLLLLLAITMQPAAGGRMTNRTPEWHKSGRDVLKGFGNMYNPHVVQVPDGAYPFRMWLFGWAAADCNPGYPGCDAIFVARGKSLDEWEVYAGKGKWDGKMDPTSWVPVVTAGDSIFDAWHNGDPSVVLKDGVYYMLYSSTGPNLDGLLDNTPGNKDHDLCCIMGATSVDGIHWSKSKRPLLIHAPDIADRGGVKSNAHVLGQYHRPSLMFDGGKWKCWFDCWTGTDVAMGYAECPADRFLDPVAWRILRAGDNPVLHNWPNPDVVKVGRDYYSYADPQGFHGSHPWIGRRICEAVSADGVNWNVLGHILPDANTSATHVPEALVINEKERTKIIVFYSCQVGGEPYDFRYNRIRYMSRPK